MKNLSSWHWLKISDTTPLDVKLFAVSIEKEKSGRGEDRAA